MTNETHDHQDNCLMCGVRALTDGDGPLWYPNVEDEPTETSGVVLRIDTRPSPFPTAARPDLTSIELWRGGWDRVRIPGYGNLGSLIKARNLQVGDTVTVKFLGMEDIEGGRHRGTQFRKFSLHVRRGH